MEVVSPVLSDSHSRLRAHMRMKTRTLSHLRRLSAEFAGRFAIEQLAAFERKRERLIKLLTLIDSKLTEEVSALTPAERLSPDLLAFLRDESAAQDLEVQAVLADDETILTGVRSAQNDLLREISRTSKQGQEINRFKSEWVSRSGEGIDSRA